MKRLLFILSALVLGVGIGLVQPPQDVASAAPQKAAPQKAQKKHPRGHVPAPPAVRARLHAEALKRHGNRVAKLPKVTAPTWDCRTAGNVLPVDDQGSCGDCFGISSADGASMALVKAGLLPLDPVKGRLSGQYGLDFTACFSGGCNGGDEAQVIDYIKTNGMPLTSDYGPYTGAAGTPKDVSGMRMWKIADWGYCTPAQQSGIASTQDIKNCMVQYGPISVAFDASECDSYTWPAVMSGTGTSVDHAVLCIGWDDSKQAFLGYNQWGVGWPAGATGANAGCFWIGYGADSWGTEAIFMVGSNLPPPPPPPQTVAVPNVVGQAWAAAQAALTAAGLMPASAQATGVVVSQAPVAGTQVATGSTVTCVLSSDPPPPPPPPSGQVATATLTFADGSTQTLISKDLQRAVVSLTYSDGTVVPVGVAKITFSDGSSQPLGPGIKAKTVSGWPAPDNSPPAFGKAFFVTIEDAANRPAWLQTIAADAGLWKQVEVSGNRWRHYDHNETAGKKYLTDLGAKAPALPFLLVIRSAADWSTVSPYPQTSADVLALVNKAK
jgi:hypothetical protein